MYFHARQKYTVFLCRKHCHSISQWNLTPGLGFTGMSDGRRWDTGKVMIWQNTENDKNKRPESKIHAQWEWEYSMLCLVNSWHYNEIHNYWHWWRHTMSNDKNNHEHVATQCHQPQRSSPDHKYKEEGWCKRSRLSFKSLQTTSAFIVWGSRQAGFAVDNKNALLVLRRRLSLTSYWKKKQPAPLVSIVSADSQQCTQANYEWPRCAPQYIWY